MLYMLLRRVTAALGQEHRTESRTDDFTDRQLNSKLKCHMCGLFIQGRFVQWVMPLNDTPLNLHVQCTDRLAAPYTLVFAKYGILKP